MPGPKCSANVTRRSWCFILKIMQQNIIIKSKVKNQANWEGKGFNDSPAKLYFSFTDASDALQSYWFHEGIADNRRIEFVILSDEDMNMLLYDKKIKI